MEHVGYRQHHALVVGFIPMSGLAMVGSTFTIQPKSKASNGHRTT